MGNLVLLPPLITAFFLIVRGFTWTFVIIWIPLMIFIPTYFEYDAPGVPPMTFYLTGFIPFVFTPELRRAAFRDFHWLDLFVYAFVLVIALSEYLTTGFNSGRQLLILNALIFVGPYLAMKHIVLNQWEEVRTARVFVFLMAVIAAYNIYTFRMGFNHFLWLRNFWPYFYEASNIIVIPRWGFFRAQGPFVHPISAGIAFGFALPMTFWLVRYRRIKPVWLGYLVAGLCLLGLFMTMSRGPMLGAVVAGGLYLIGQSRLRKQWFSAVGLVILFSALPVGLKLVDYLSLTRATAKTDTQETVLYRKELIINYMDVVFEKPVLGYGFMNVPYVGDQRSIDNAYILFALNWGLLTVFIMGVLLGGSLLALFRLGFNNRIDQVNRGIVWALIGGIAGCAFSMTTVFLARPISTLLFMWFGWAAALLMRRRRGWLEEEQTLAEATVEKAPPRRMVIL
ncbi:MAG: O-antigen ligase family protein [Acidobacteriota bacterium]|nr:O-antigen ligase family protein [Acidobacteriota bacterium]